MLKYTIHDLAPDEKPRERLANFGTSSLTDTELLAIILRSGGKDMSALDLARGLLHRFDGFRGFFDSSLEQLINFENVGLAKAASIKAFCEISLRINSKGVELNKIIKNPSDIAQIVKKDLFGKKKENLILVSLDSRNRFIAKDTISVGTVSETVVHPREVFRQALLRNAVSIALVHNHPSQDITPSASDILLTEQIAKVGAAVGVTLVDHVIVTDSEYNSMRALGIFELTSLDREGVKNNEKDKE